MDATRPLPLDDLLAHADWLRRLARRLVQDEASADDLVQDAWVAALRRPPAAGTNPRAWLGRVVRNAAATRHKLTSRREAREERGAREEALPATADVVAEAGAAQELAAAVLALGEPYRTVLLLRYWRDRSPSRIARELERPVGTVKTQLQRGLERLRARLDGAHGGRQAWVAALLPLAREAGPAGGLLAGPTAILVAAGALAVAGTAALVLGPGLGGERASDGSGSGLPDGVAAAAAARGDSGPATVDAAPAARSVVGAAPTASTRDEPERAATAAETFPFRGRLVDLDGRPLAGASVAWSERLPLRWADAEETLLTGASVWVRVDPATRERLRVDAAAREAFVRANLPDTERSRALLAGTPPPLPRSRTDAEGTFELAASEPFGQLVLEEPDFGIVGRGRRAGASRALWIAAPSWTLTGVVRDADGLPVADATLRLQERNDSLRGDFEDWTELIPEVARATTDAAGRFHVEGVAGGRVLSWSASVEADAEATLAGGAAKGELRLPDARGPRRLDGLELHLDLERLGGVQLEGRVLHADGRPAARALVALGPVWCWSDREGRYRLRLAADGLAEDRGRSNAKRALVAVKAGTGILRRADFADELTGLAGRQAGPDLVLPGAGAELSGRVLDGAGAPVEGAAVTLADGTHVPGLEQSLEEIARRGARLSATTDVDGRFRIHGLEERDYQLTARHAEHGSSARRAAPGGSPVVVRLAGSDG